MHDSSSNQFTLDRGLDEKHPLQQMQSEAAARRMPSFSHGGNGRPWQRVGGSRQGRQADRVLRRRCRTRAARTGHHKLAVVRFAVMAVRGGVIGRTGRFVATMTTAAMLGGTNRSVRLPACFGLMRMVPAATTQYMEQDREGRHAVNGSAHDKIILYGDPIRYPSSGTSL